MNKQRLQKGASLIEVMVALFVLAIGLLGFAGLQTEGITMGRQAYMHSQAGFLAQDIVERIVANRAEAVSGKYDTSFGDTPADKGCATGTTQCSATDLAEFDRFQWLANITASLPSGQGSVATAVNGNVTRVTVTIQYQLAYGRLSSDEQQGNVAAPQTYTYTMVTEI